MAYLSQPYASWKKNNRNCVFRQGKTKKYSVLQERYHENGVAFCFAFYIRLIEKQCDICGKEHLHSWYILENIRCVSLLLVYKNLTRGFLLI